MIFSCTEQPKTSKHQSVNKDRFMFKDTIECKLIFSDLNTATVETSALIDSVSLQTIADSFKLSKDLLIYFHLKNFTEREENYGTLYSDIAIVGLHSDMKELMKKREQRHQAIADAGVSNPDFARIAFVISKTFVKQNLKSPTSAEFPFSEYTFSNVKDNTVTIRSYVDAQNEFGAKIRNTYVIVLKLTGDESTDASNWRMLSFRLE